MHSQDAGNAVDRPDWQRPPFEKGHTLSLRHGAYSERAIAERAEQVHHELLAVAPWLADDRFMPAVAAYLRAVARESLAQAAIDSWDPTAGKFPTRLFEVANACARTAWSMADELGLTPAGHSRLKLVTAGAAHAEHTIADLLAEGAEIRRRAEARLAAEAAQRAVQPPDGPEAPQTSSDEQEADDGR